MMDSSIKEKQEQKKGCLWLIILLVVLAAIGFVFLSYIGALRPGGNFGGAGFIKPKPSKGAPVYDVEPQIVYRLDEHRYLQLEKYESCEPTVKDIFYSVAYYYDDFRGIKTRIPTGFRDFRGRLINADSSGKNIVFALTPSRFGGSDRGKGAQVAYYSTDYGQSFTAFPYTSPHSSNPSRDSEDYTVVITEKELAAYDGDEWGYFVRKLDFEQLDERGEFVKSHESRASLPNYPVLMNKYECNTEIVPRKIEYIPIEEYKQLYGERW